MGLILLLALAVVSPQQPAPPATGRTPLADVDGVVITEADVAQALGATLAKLEEQVYTLKRSKLEGLIDERLLEREAARRGVTVDALVAEEIDGKAGAVTDVEVTSFYEKNKARLKGDEATLAPQVRTYLEKQKRASRRLAYVRSLREAATVTVFLTPPPVFRATVDIEGAPRRGAAAGPVTIVEFSDFHCPFCRKVQPSITQLLARYPEQVRLAHRDFPLDSLHPAARAAAEAARCAGAQGRFWEYHDKLYAAPPEATPDQLAAMAKAVGLDLDRFEACRGRREFRDAVQKDIDEGGRLGVAGTPAFFINGRALSGAQPLDAFVKIIEEELARARK